MGMRRSLLRISVFTTAILLFFLGWTTIPELQRARRFETALSALTQLSPAERLQVLDRIAWLNGLSMMPSVAPVSGSGLQPAVPERHRYRKRPVGCGTTAAVELEDLARKANVPPQWDVICWRFGLFAGTIALLWVLLFVGFRITSQPTRFSATKHPTVT